MEGRHQSKVEVYLHLVWATKGRQDRLTGEYERAVYRVITAEAHRLRCTVIALGGIPDHVHLLVRAPGSVSPAILAKQVKGVTSSLMNDLRPDFSDQFRWQDGYGCFSIWRSQVERVAAYVQGQKEHHASGQLWPEWEMTNEPADTSPAPESQ